MQISNAMLNNKLKVALYPESGSLDCPSNNRYPKIINKLNATKYPVNGRKKSNRFMLEIISAYTIITALWVKCYLDIILNSTLRFLACNSSFSSLKIGLE